MSADAERYVAACINPKVKGGARALLVAIARSIPEGQTATPPMSLDDLAVTAHHSPRTARTNRDVLVAAGEIKVHGGQGQPARFEMLRLTEGARPLTEAPLPLIGRPKPRRTKTQRSTSAVSADLFDATSAVSAEVPGGAVAYFGSFCRRWWSRIVNIGSFCRRWAFDIGSFCRSTRPTSAVSAEVHAPLSSSYVRTEEVVDARAREPADEFLDWFEATYPLEHGGAACSVPRARDRPLVCQLLTRLNTDVAHLQAMARLLWIVTTDGVVKSDRWWIAERVTVRNVFVLHRKADYLDAEVRRLDAEAARGEDGDTERREVEQRLGRDWRKSG